MKLQILLAFGGTDRSREAAEKLKEILASGEFAEKKNLGILDYIAGMINDILDWIKQFVDKLKMPDKMPLGTGRNITPGKMPPFTIVGVLLIIALLSVVIFFIAKNLKNSKKLAEEDMELLTILKDSGDASGKAIDFCRKGDFRQGIRFLYLAFLIGLNEINVIRIDKSKTNKQYINEARENGYCHVDDMEGFTAVFNKCWYGGKAADMKMFDYCMDIYNHLQPESGGRIK